MWSEVYQRFVSGITECPFIPLALRRVIKFQMWGWCQGHREGYIWPWPSGTSHFTGGEKTEEKSITQGRVKGGTMVET